MDQSLRIHDMRRSACALQTLLWRSWPVLLANAVTCPALLAALTSWHLPPNNVTNFIAAARYTPGQANGVIPPWVQPCSLQCLRAALPACLHHSRSCTRSSSAVLLLASFCAAVAVLWALCQHGMDGPDHRPHAGGIHTGRTAVHNC